MKYQSLNGALATVFGENVHIVGKRPIYGGDINRSYRLSLSDGSSVFMKCNKLVNYPFFEKETEGLAAPRSLGTIGVPKPFASGVDETESISFLLMEFLDASPRRKDYWETLGRELALMHGCSTERFVMGRTYASDGSQIGDDESGGNKKGTASENNILRYGFYTDNYIGATLQKNTPKSGWIEFFRDCRLVPQLQMAEKQLGMRTRLKCERLLERLDSLLEEPEFPSLLHGDLWSGNVVCGLDGKAWILDPAVYVGNFEAELAMTELFGGYPDSFYRAYQEINPIPSGYEERRDLYNLYHMLNHLNLFGTAYLGEVNRIVGRYV